MGVLMAVDRSTLEKMEPIGNSMIVCIPFCDVGVTCGEMCGDKADIGVMIVQAYANRALIPRHPAQPGLQ